MTRLYASPLDEETWLTADEALNYGLIDEVSESKDVATSH
nr:ATP-dependent Clp protease proteolytic subunit [Bacillus licheniformis]